MVDWIMGFSMHLGITTSTQAKLWGSATRFIKGLGIRLQIHHIGD
jgi:hypothetical protein